ncbi:GROUP II PYRIDOXAL-5-PHOSPHATE DECARBOXYLASE [Salix purpurea]|uniref:GROUP II PYRIDOXAL-5-PHOSPHATE DECARBOXYLASE n=1 Tax=Salix purpurea TaxID=77065 RepID=A0A9Q0ZSB0_SALPP|nr:GROUP II PYRIDOXAL-5-PHOSPHATE DECARBOXYLASE [Salix purpurea]
MDWLAKMLKLPRTFMFSGSGGAVIQNTPSEAVLATVVAARDRVLHNIDTFNVSKVRTVLEADVAAGLVPLYLYATDVANDFGLWVHVDAAYGGSSCICPELRHHFNGIERVDSLSLSPHKWLTHMAKTVREVFKI